MSGLRFSNHFISRYAERILGQKPSDEFISGFKNKILDDMRERIMDRERTIIDTFKNCSGTVKVPFDRTHEIVMMNKTFITVY